MSTFTDEDVEKKIKTSFFNLNDDKLNALINESKINILKPMYSILRYQDDIYRQILFKTQVMFNMGNITLKQAIDIAAKDFLAAGITNIEYKNGAKIHIADYVAMALRTANHRAFLMGEGKKRQELGVSTVIVSNHLTSCPLCGKWENKVLIDDVYSGGKKEDGNYPLVSEAIEKGLLHPNCRHNLNTFFEGISKIPSGEKKNFKSYELTQEQRKLERDIRKQKRKVLGTVDYNNLQREKLKLKELENNLKQFHKNNPITRRNYMNEKIHDGNIKKHENQLLEKLKNDKIKEIREYIKSDKCNKVIHKGRQGKHILGHNNYKGNSYLAYGTNPQELVDKYAGTGLIKIIRTAKGLKWVEKEFVYVKNPIGYYKDSEIGTPKSTRYFCIHYSKKHGTHISPREEPKYD